MENRLTKKEVIKLVGYNNTAFWCCVVTIALNCFLSGAGVFPISLTEMDAGSFWRSFWSFICVFVLSCGPMTLWQVEYCKLAFGTKNGFTIICWFIQVLLWMPALIVFFKPNTEDTGVIVIYGIVALTLVISIYRFFKKQGLSASFITYISKANCEKYMNS